MYVVGVPQKQLVLDRMASTATMVYACRLMTAKHKGRPLLNVRRSSDNVSRDIYYDVNGVLDVGDLLGFVGASDGFITKWYDQSQIRNDAENATTTTQPKIVVSGAVQLINSRPAILTNATNNTVLSMTGLATGLNTISSVHNVSTSVVSLATLITASGDNPIIRRNITPTAGWRAAPTQNYGNSSTSTINGVPAPGTSEILNAAGVNTVATFYSNGAAMTPISLFFSPLSTRPMTGLIGELIGFADTLVAADRKTLEYDQSLHYGIGIAL
jgi:hypothetical protein